MLKNTKESKAMILRNCKVP